MDKELVYNAYEDFCYNLDTMLENKENIDDFIMSIHYDIVDNSEDMQEATAILQEIEEILTCRYLRNLQQ